MGRVGILGGTFNPPHRGHVAIALAARAELNLDRVYLLPVHTPPHKPAAPDPGPRHRLEMARLAAAAGPGLEACSAEVDRGGPSYTVDTLESIHASHPHAELTFILGADSAATLPAWREPARLLALAQLAVAERPGSDRRLVLDAVAGIDSGAAARVRFLDATPIDVSASEIRGRVAAGEPIEDLVGAGVAGYIDRHGLYRSAS